MQTLMPTIRPTALVPIFGGFTLGSRLWDVAGRIPSLDLQLATRKSLADAVTGASLVTFTRSTIGTYTDSAGVLQTASTDVPRFDHNPTTGESMGLLVEEQRTNLLLRSEEFQTTWSILGTVTADAITAPNGTVTADLITTNGTSAQPFQGVTISSGATITGSCFLKPNGINETEIVLLSNNNTTPYARATFNTSTGVISVAVATANGGTSASANIQAFANGWYRCSVTVTYPAVTLAGIRINAAGATGGIYVWGAQLEAGAFPTSYIPTTTAAVTRNADVASITGSAFSGWYRQDEGTVFAEGAVAQPVSGGNQFFFRSSDNSFNNSNALNIQSSGFASIATAAGGVFDGAASSLLALSANTAAKFAGAYAAHNLGVSLNGATTTTDTSATMPTALTRADIGSDHIGANRVKAGTIKRLCYWPQRLANSTIQQLTQ